MSTEIKAPTPRQLRAYGSEAAYYAAERGRLDAQEQADAWTASDAGKFESKLITLGGNLWAAEGKRRVYFNTKFLADNTCVDAYCDTLTGKWIVCKSSRPVDAGIVSAQIIGN